MRAFLKSQGGRVWRSIETGWTEPTETNAEGEKVAKSFEKYSKEEATLAECNDKALNALFGAVDSSQYRLISNCTEAKKAWEILETTHEGDERVKTAKLQILMTKYENLRMDEENDEDPSDGDYQEQLSLITKQFKKQWMQKKGRPNYQAESSKGFQFRNPRPKDSKKRKAFVTTWSDEEDDTEEVLGNSNCAFTTQVHNEDSDNLTNQLEVLQKEVDSLRRKLDETMQQLEQIEGEKANLNYELTQLKSYQKWMKSAGAEQIESLVDKSRFYGDRTGIGHTLPTSSKTPLDLFVTRSKISEEELAEYSRDKKEAVQPSHTHVRKHFFSNYYWNYVCFYCRKKGHIKRQCHQLKNKKKKRGTAKGFTRTVMKWVPKHMASSANSCLKVTPDQWLLDSGCSHHMTGDKQNLLNIQPMEGGNVRFGGGAHGQIIGIGTLHVSGLPPIKNVWLVQGLEVNLLSISQICDQGLEVVFTQQKCRIKDRNKFVVLEENTRNLSMKHREMVRTKIVVPKQWKKTHATKKRASLIQKFVQARANLRAKISQEDEGSPSVNPEIETAMEHEEVQRAPEVEKLSDEEKDEAPLNPDLPTIMLLEYKPLISSEEQHQNPEVDEEFQILLDEDPLVAVSEVPFKNAENQDKTPRSSKKKAKQTTDQHPTRWSKRRTRSEAVMKEESSPSPKKTRTSSPSSSKVSKSKRGKDLNRHSGKSSTHTFVNTAAKSYLPTIVKKHILPQRNIDLEDFALKTTLIPLLDARKLLKSVTIPGSYVKQVIHEFYCNLNEDFVNPAAESFEKVFVRGKLYTFSSTAVNKFLGLDDVHDALISEATMWKELTHGTRKSQHPSNKVPSSILNSSYSILLRVAACHWLATSHINTVTKVMGMLLYKIKNNVPVNLGKLIVAQIAEFGKHNYKHNDNGLPFPVLIFQMLVSQGFNKKDGEQEEPLEPLLQVDNRHFDGKHFNDMKIAEQATHGVPGVLKYLQQKLQQNKEALLMVDQQKKVLEEERQSLIWLQENAAQNAQAEGSSFQGESSEEEEDTATDTSA
ncbi:unnamed protein product [Cuscuta campestris]|uniref:CCHC-type domain-containing protein n=1 Tax=Cuscuta campestris TaxID=132261 RepID=A0A484LAH1_9ASTE|nr:unnamed protein product [Cuscuta campestris]